MAGKTHDSAVPKHIKTTEGYRVSLRRRKMIEEAFAWVKDLGRLRRLMARGLDTIKIRAHALPNCRSRIGSKDGWNAFHGEPHAGVLQRRFFPAKLEAEGDDAFSNTLLGVADPPMAWGGWR